MAIWLIGVDPSWWTENRDQRAAREARAAGAVEAAMRHAGVATPAESIRVQREPFELKGTRADAFEVPTRLSGRSRYHEEITFSDFHHGPLWLGDGRFVGLGLFAPAMDVHRDVFVFPLPAGGRLPLSERRRLLTEVRRALMALARDEVGRGKTVPKLFSGHERDGAPASATGRHEHVFLAATDADGDGLLDRLYVIALWAGDRLVQARRLDKHVFERVIRFLD